MCALVYLKEKKIASRSAVTFKKILSMKTDRIDLKGRKEITRC